MAGGSDTSSTLAIKLDPSLLLHYTFLDGLQKNRRLKW